LLLFDKTQYRDWDIQWGHIWEDCVSSRCHLVISSTTRWILKMEKLRWRMATDAAPLSAKYDKQGVD